ncbi:MAG: DNA methyltransferase [Xanthobacteraceae bacterium]
MRSMTNVPTGSIKRNARNARTHSKRQVRQIANSIREFGFGSPLLVDEDSVLLAGHGRLAAAQQLGLATVPVVIMTGLTDAKKRAFALADNRLPESAGWNRQLLSVEIPELVEALRSEDIDPAVLGFEPTEIDQLAADFAIEDLTEEEPPIRLRNHAVSRRGDHWRLGDHRLLCGDARDAAVLRSLMGGEHASMVFTDPPYNVRIRGVVGRGKVSHDEFAMASGELTSAEFRAFLSTTLALAANHSLQGAVHFVAMDWRHIADLLEVGKGVYPELLNICCWVKTNAGQGSFYRSQHELIAVFRVGEAKHQNNIELGKHGRNRSNVWRYAGVNTFRTGRMKDLRSHPTVKPVAMVKDAIQDVTRRHEIVLDPFCGSGTTILAAEQVGRRACALEIEPRYVDVAIDRWQVATKKDAVCVVTGLTFGEIEERRKDAKAANPRQLTG